jgi:hypothetical protein
MKSVALDPEQTKANKDCEYSFRNAQCKWGGTCASKETSWKICQLAGVRLGLSVRQHDQHHERVQVYPCGSQLARQLDLQRLGKRLQQQLLHQNEIK